MEKQNFVVTGGMKLPIGYRFHPTDEELVVHYLNRKAFGVPLPASVIPDLDVFQTNPWNLPGNLKEKRYFFSLKLANDKGGKPKRGTAGCGYWKPVGKVRQIVASASNQAVGMRQTLIFCQGKNSIKTKNQWVTHEYRLVGLEPIPNSTQMCKVKIGGEWVVYSVFQRKRRPQKPGVVSRATNVNKIETIDVIRPSFMDFAMEERDDIAGPPQPSSPSSCGATEVIISSNNGDEEETSSFISFSSYSFMRKS